MRKPATVLLAAVLTLGICGARQAGSPRAVRLPDPRLESETSLEQAIANRRSRRSFADKPLTLEQLGQVLWAAQGITGPDGVKRAAPSAGGTYPMVVTVSVRGGGVDGLPAGVYRYRPEGHALEKAAKGDHSRELAAAGGRARYLLEAPVVLALAADYSRVTARYPERGRRYAILEAGHVGQNVYLQAEALGLGTVTAGGFDDDAVREALALPEGVTPLELMPVGHPE